MASSFFHLNLIVFHFYRNLERRFIQNRNTENKRICFYWLRKISWNKVKIFTEELCKKQIEKIGEGVDELVEKLCESSSNEDESTSELLFINYSCLIFLFINNLILITNTFDNVKMLLIHIEIQLEIQNININAINHLNINTL